MTEEQLRRMHRLSSFQIITGGFACVILVGALLLMLPISSAGGLWTPFHETLFTATSAVCVTGLVVQDTGTYWSSFGQAIILMLIQIGGLGIITMAIAIVLFSGRKISLVERNMMADSINAPYLSGILRITRFILLFTAIVEGAGAVSLMTVFIPRFGAARGIWYAVFHSVSAFCNAGFDLMGRESGKFSSLTAFTDSPVVNITIMALIVIGGIGFVTWNDMITKGPHFSRYRMQTKTVLIMTLSLIVIPAIYFYVCEYGGEAMPTRILASFFQSVTTRTAGFNTTDLTKLSEAGIFIFIVLMLIGGSPGSTAGGMKTTTVAVLFSQMLSVFRRSDSTPLFRRRIDEETTRKASALLLMYIFLFSLSAIIISRVEGIPMLTCLFETASAVGTVGLTLGITPGLHAVSRILLMLLMYAGRVGGLTLIYATLSNDHSTGKLPLERITVG